MARIRSVHPSLFTDDAWVSCSAFARLLYIGLWTDADDQGLFVWKPLQLKMKLFPGDSIDVPPLLEELVEAELIASFSHAGAKYGAIKDFRKYQRPKKPNAIHFMPSEFRTYVALDVAGTEPGDDDGGGEPPEPRPGSELRQQMEDGGGVKEERSETIVSSLSPRASRKAKSPIEDGFPGQPEIDQAAQEIQAAGVTLDAVDQAKRFRSYALTQDRRVADWDAAWRGWIEIEIGKAPAAPAVAAPLPSTWNGPEALAAAIAAEMGAARAGSYLGRCVWGADRTVVAPNGFVADALTNGAPEALAANDAQVVVAGRAVA